MQQNPFSPTKNYASSGEINLMNRGRAVMPLPQPSLLAAACGLCVNHFGGDACVHVSFL